MNAEGGHFPRPLEAVRAEVMGEIAQFKGGIVPYLNNFKNWLRPAHLEIFANNRWLISRRDSTKTHREQMLPEEKEEGHSDAWLNDTPVSFIEKVDEAMAYAGITPEEVHRIDIDASDDYIIGDLKHIMLAVFILRPYVWLRAKGYNRLELTQ